MSFAQITVVGNVGGMPDFRTVGEREVCNFSIAVNRKVKKEKVTTWFSVVSWDERKNQIVKDFVRKGDQVMVVGELRPREYTDKQGNDRTALDVDISFNGNLVLLANNREEQEEQPRERARSRSNGASAPPRTEENTIPSDDIPF